MTATTECMISPYLINVGYLQQITRNTVFTGFADPLNFLEDDRVYLYSGTKDYTVVPGNLKCWFNVLPLAFRFTKMTQASNKYK